jgi:hypothetical protein
LPERVLLRPATREAEMSGHLALRGVSGQTAIEFRYHVLRVWEEPAERFLSGGIGVLPLALIADVAVPDTAEVMARIRLNSSAATRRKALEEGP